MNIVHVSDTHLGYREFHRIDPQTGINQREQDVYDAFRDIIDRILDLEPDLVIHAGDLFDNIRPTNRAVNVATDQLARLSEADITTVVIAGNHDTPKISTTGTITRSLDRLAKVEAVTSDPTGENQGYRKIPVGDALIHAVSDTPTEQGLAKRIKELEPDNGYSWNVLVLHAGIRALEGAIFSGEFNEHHVNRELLENTGFDYIALGHYHKRMEVELSSETKAVYSGAPERFSFKESSYRPGFVIVNLTEDGVGYSEQLIPTREFIDLGVIEAEGLSVEELINEIESRFSEDREVADSLVSLTLNGVNSNVYSLLEEEYLNDLRDRCFETNFHVMGPEDFSSTDSSLSFSDLRVEFSDFIENSAEVPEEVDSDEIIEIGQKYLGIALGEED